MANRVLKKWEKRLVKGYLRNGQQKKPPMSVNVEPTNFCNLRCPICPHGFAGGSSSTFTRKQGYLSVDTFETILAQCKQSVRMIALYLHGEPFLNPDLPEMAACARERGLSVNIFTNGMELSQDALKQTLEARPRSLAVSMDLISRQGYLRFKGKDLFYEACENMDTILKTFEQSKSKVKLTLRTIYGGETKQQVEAFLDRWLQKPVHSIQLTHPFPWPRQKDADILSNRVTSDKDAICPQVWNALNIFWDGRVSPCSFDFDASYIIGNILEDPLDVILNSKKARRFRKLHILGKREKIAICRNCMLPRFRFDIITIKRNEYLKFGPEQKDTLLERVLRLRFSPVMDFLNPSQYGSERMEEAIG